MIITIENEKVRRLLQTLAAAIQGSPLAKEAEKLMIFSPACVTSALSFMHNISRSPWSI
jgi:hypothetical protein